MVTIPQHDDPAPGRTARRYHHGALREALLDAVEAGVREEGLEGVSLRNCARRVGVSHAAAFRHFADKRALLTAFAARSARRLAASMDEHAAQAESEGERFLHMGVGYIAFAMREPDAFRAVFRENVLDSADPDYREALSELEARLGGASSDAAEEAKGAAEGASGDGSIPPAALLVWGATHGLATLCADGGLARDLPKGRELEAMMEALRLLGPVLRR